VIAALDRRLYVPPEVTDFRSLRKPRSSGSYELPEVTILRSYETKNLRSYDRRKTKPYGTPCVRENVGTHGNPDDTIVRSCENQNLRSTIVRKPKPTNFRVFTRTSEHTGTQMTRLHVSSRERRNLQESQKTRFHENAPSIYMPNVQDLQREPQAARWRFAGSTRASRGTNAPTRAWGDFRKEEKLRTQSGSTSSS
jgi:hypothetical protein